MVIRTAKEMEAAFIRQIEESNTYTELINLVRKMMESFSAGVKESRTNHTLSPEIRLCCDYIKKHRERPLHLQELAAEVGYTEYYLSRKFQKEMGIKLLDYIRQVRLDYAKIMGESAGGTMACLIGTTGGCPEFEKGDWLDQSSAVQGVVDYYGVTKIRPIPHVTGRIVPYYAFDAFIAEDFTEEMGKKASAVEYVSKHSAPTLILHGAKDPMVSMDQSEGFYELLQKNGVRADLVIVEGATHGDDLFYQDAIADRILAFLESL